MNFTISNEASYILAWLGTIGGIWTLFCSTETVLNDQQRSKISNWLLTDDYKKALRDWPTLFILIFDTLFHKKHFTWKCFKRSSLASAFLVLIMASIITSLHGQNIWDNGVFPSMGLPFSTVYFLIFTVVFNFLPDYLSLFETRKLVQLMTRTTPVLFPVILLLDIFFTLILFTLFLFLGIYLVTNVIFHWSEPTSKIWLVIKRMLPEALSFWNKSESSTLGVWLYSSFFTSVWLWLFSVGFIVSKLLLLTFRFFKWFNRIFNVEEKPLQVMGFIFMIIATVIFAVLPFT